MTWRPSLAPPLILAALLAAGCGGEESSTDESGESTERVEELPQVELPPEAPPDRRPDGSLLESDDYVAGLRLPRGLREVAVDGHHHFYEGDYVAEAYVNYFGPRLLTGTVEQLPGGGARYVEATAREPRGTVVVMDVLISPAGATQTLVTVDERPAPPEHPRSEADVIRDLQLGVERGH